jgi:WD40 repeat protein
MVIRMGCYGAASCGAPRKTNVPRRARFAVVGMGMVLPVVLAACSDQGGPPARIVPEVGPARPHRVAFSPSDGSRVLVLEASGRVSLWRMQSPLAPASLATMATGAFDACFAPDGNTILTSGVDGRVRRWAPNGRLIWSTKEGHAGPARAVAAAGDLVVSGGDDGSVRLWAGDGVAMGDPLTGHGAPILSVAGSALGDVLSAGTDGTVRLWRRPAPDAAYQGQILYQLANPMSRDTVFGTLRFQPSWSWRHTVAFGPNDDVMGGSILDDTARLWNPDGSLRKELARPFFPKEIRALAFAPSGTVLATGGLDENVRLWTLGGEWRGLSIRAHASGVFSIDFSPDGRRLVTTGGDERVRQWGLDGSMIAELPARRTVNVTVVALSPTEPLIAVADADDGGVHLWSLDASREAAAITGGKHKITALAFSSRGDRLAIGDKTGAVQLRKLDGSPAGELPSENAAVGAVAFSPGGDTLACASLSLRLRASNGDVLQRPAVAPDSMTAVAFAPDGKSLAVGTSFGRIQALSSDGAPRFPPIKLPMVAVSAIAFAQKGELFASAGGSEKIVRLWRLDGSAVDPPLEGHLDVVTSLAATSDASLLASGSADSTVRLWSLPSRQVEVVEVGVPVDQVGFWRGALWARGGDTIFFYDRSRRLFATTLVRPDGALTFTPDGWFTGPGPLHAYAEGGKRMSVRDTAARAKPKKVAAAFAKAVEGS